MRGRADPGFLRETNRHRLSRGGDRDANRALYLLAVGPMGWDPATRTYVTRRTAAGLSKPEIIRCLKRYLAREIYRILVKPSTSGSLHAPLATPPAPRESLLTTHRSITLGPSYPATAWRPALVLGPYSLNRPLTLCPACGWRGVA